MLTWFRGSRTHPPILLNLRSSRTFITTTVASAIFTDIFCYGIIVPVLPFALESRANIKSGSMQTWMSIFLAVYGASILATAPVCGWLADRSKSRQMPLLLGLLALGGSTAILCVGCSHGVLAAGRVLQGISAAVVWVVGLALLVDTVGPEEIGVAMGYVGLSMSLGLVVSPLLGGIVFNRAGYYAVFAMAFGLFALDVALRVFMIEKKVAKKWLTDAHASTQPIEADEYHQHAGAGVRDLKKNDGLKGRSTEEATTQSHLPSEGIRIGDSATPPSVAPTTAVTAGSLRERFAAKLPPVLFLLASRRVCNAIWASLIQATILTSFDAVLPSYVRDTFGWNSVGAGLIFLPIVVVSFLGPFVGRLSDRHGPRWYATAGYVLACPSVILLRLVDHNTLEQKALLCVLLALLGVCLTLVLTPIMAEITYAVDATAKRRPPGFFGKNGAYAQAYSLFNVAWAGGCLFGPLLAGLVNQAYGWKVTTLILGCVSLVTAVPTVIWTGGSIFKQIKRRWVRERGSSV